MENNQSLSKSVIQLKITTLKISYPGIDIFHLFIFSLILKI